MQGRVGLGLSQAEQLLCELVRLLHLSSRQIRHQLPQHRKSCGVSPTC